MQFTVETAERLTCVDVTDRVETAVRETLSGADDTSDTADSPESALCTVFVRHTTAGVIVQEPESRLLGDVETFLRVGVGASAGDGAGARSLAVDSTRGV